jgi:hypothetical protein
MSGPADLPNPLTRYPQPPFEKQSQPWPGLASQMNPPPDHGEKSYKGSGRHVPKAEFFGFEREAKKGIAPASYCARQVVEHLVRFTVADNLSAFSSGPSCPSCALSRGR